MTTPTRGDRAGNGKHHDGGAADEAPARRANRDL